MRTHIKGLNVSKTGLDFARKSRAVIAGVITAGIVTIVAMAPAEQSIEVLGSAHAADPANNYGNGPTGYFPDQFGRPSGAIEPQPETF